jgi:O-antigen ligase
MLNFRRPALIREGFARRRPKMTPSQFAPDLRRTSRRGQPLAAAMFHRDAKWVGFLHNVLLFAYLELSFVGLSPLSEVSVAERVEGSAPVRNAILALFGLALPVLAARRRAVWLCMRANWRFWLVTFIAIASVAWSDYPDLTIRRSLMFFLLAIIVMAIAVSIDDLRAFHTKLFGAITAIVILNLVVTAAVPSLAISVIGVQGIYLQKNEAGMVGMLAVIFAVTWSMGCDSFKGRLIGVLSALISLFFLVITQSKTSIGLLVFTLAIGLVFWLARRFGSRMALLVFAGLGALLAALFSVFIFQDFSWGDILKTFVSDPTFTGRDELWAFCYRESLKRNWLGHGYGAFWDVGAFNDPLAKLEPGSWMGDIAVGFINEAHNGYLELWLVIGLPAMLMAVWQVFSSIAATTRAAMESNDRGAVPAFAMIAMILFNHLLHNFTEATLFMRSNPFSNTVTLLILAGFLAVPSSAHAPDCERARAFPTR